MPAAGNLVPDFTPTRTFWSPSSTIFVRVPRPSFSSNSCTLEMWIEPSFSTMPPCGFFCVALHVALDHRDLLDDHAVTEHAQDLAALALVGAGDHDHEVALTNVCARIYSTSGASEMIFMNRLARSSRATGPKMRVPIGSFSLLMRTAELPSNLM